MEGEALLTQLDETQKALVVALEEACAADLAKLDTPELIRIEETLDVASKAAKQAVSVRRRLDSQTEHTNKQPPTAAPVPHRVLEDTGGKRWHVFAVQSSTALGGRTALPEAFRSGWLVFDSAEEVRRVAPIPTGWENLPEDKLRGLCEKTLGARKRAGAPELPRDSDPTIKR